MAPNDPAIAEAPSALDGLLAARRDASATGPAWLGSLRKEAWARFEAMGFPAPNDEEWRQTPVAPLKGIPFVSPPAVSDPEASVLPESLGGPRIVFVQGRLSRRLSSLDPLPEGVTIHGLADGRANKPETGLASVTPWRDRPFAALNTALFVDGAVVEIARATAVRAPIEIVHVTLATGSAPPVIHPRLLVRAGAGAEAIVVETFLSTGDRTYWTDAVAEFVLEENARVDHVRIQAEGGQAFHVASVDARQGRDSRFTSHNLAWGAAWARCDIGSRLDGPGAEARLYGLTLAGESTHVDHHTVLDHAQAHCPSHELYKSILWDRARYVFNGRIVVHPDAQKTDAKQSNRNLILSDEAVVYTRPQLEIFADDVRCTHGATIGRLDADALFYLRARGLGAGEARALLIRAFAGEVLEHLPHRVLRERLEEAAVSRIPSATRV